MVGQRRRWRLGLTSIATSLVVSTIVIVAVAPEIAHAAAITVDSTLDEQVANGACSFREALANAEGTASNGDCAPGTSGPDTIIFAISGSGLHTISIVNQPLQPITDQVSIDGLSQPGSAVGAPTIEIIGRPGENLLNLSASTNSSVKGLILSGAAGASAIVAGSGSFITGNFIGTDATGSAAAATPNETGISVISTANVTIGGAATAARNIISGNSNGIVLSGSSGNGTFNTAIAGNYIGTDTSGAAAVANIIGVQVNHDVATTSIRSNVISGNTTNGLSVVGPDIASTSLTSNIVGLNATQTGAVPNGTGIFVAGPGVGNTRIGIGVPGAENIISGNSGSGVTITGVTTSTFIQGNLIGVDSSGSARPNNIGVEVNDASDVNIGGSLSPGYRNVISGNDTGIYIHSPDPDPLPPTPSLTNTQVLGNYIGTGLTGTTAVPNNVGIYVGGDGGFVLGTIIGDGTVGGRNVISGNAIEAISLWDRANNTSIRGNYIGVAANGSPLGNNLGLTGFGAVVLRNFVTGNTIGGNTAAEGNTIANNGDDGVVAFSGSGNSILGNSMFDNTGLGIDIAGAAINDAGDPDGGANNLQNFPTITTSVTAGNLIVSAAVDSATINSEYPMTFSFYKADSLISGEGKQYLGFNAAIAGPGIFDTNLGNAAGLGVVTGDYIVATATDANGNTSNFSAPTLFVAPGTFVVDSEGDNPDVNLLDNVCDDGNARCTLRAAVQQSNAKPGTDTITFNITGTNVHTIVLGTNLPNITDALTIDGLSQPGASCATWPPHLTVEIDARNVVGNSWGITVANTSATLRGLVINHYTIDGVAALNTTGGRLECNIIGAEPDGSTGIANAQSGVFLSAGANWVIGGPGVGQRNLITGANISYQLGLTASHDNIVQNNYIGTDINGIPVPLVSRPQTNRVVLVTGHGNLIGGTGVGEGNVIAGAGQGPGILDAFDTGNSFRGNSISSNLGLGIDLGTFSSGFGVTFNHLGFLAGPNDYQNYPVLTAATSTALETRVVGTLDGLPNRTYEIDVYSAPVCDVRGFGSGEVYLGTISTTTDGTGVASFNDTVPAGTTEPRGITTTATDMTTGSTSEFSYCRAASTPNLTWVNAQTVGSGQTQTQYITDRAQEKWFKIAVQPGDSVKVQVSGLPGSAVSLHRDPLPVYNGLINPSSAAALSAEAADTAFLPSGSLPSGSLPSGSLPSGSLPSGSLPSGSLPTGFLPSGSLPSGSLPSGSLPSGSLPSGSLPSGSLPSGSLPSGSLPSGSLPSGSLGESVLPSGSLPSGSLPSGSLPSGSLPSGSLPSGSLDAYSAAARRSLLGMSADPYTAVQTIERNTYDLQESLYVRVVGPYSLATPFQLTVSITGGVCSALNPVPSNLQVIGTGPPAGGTRTSIILTDTARLPGTPTERATALADLQTLANRADVNGVVIDLADARYQRVAFANAEADAHPDCPTAKNTVAKEIKAIIDAYRAANTLAGSTTLKYVVLAGGADVIPFHQVQDIAGLANEKEYVPPVEPNSPSEAGLRSGLVKGQDFYGSSLDLTIGGNTLAVPDLAVGRLVDTAADVSAAVNAYIATNGVVTPRSSLVTGYDFVGDAAAAVKTEIEAGTAATADFLIQPPGHAPNAIDAWTADQLRTKLLAGNHDIMMLSGHFSSGTLLAADYRTTLTASEVAQSTTDLTDTIVLALGCHSGFSLPTGDLLNGASPDPDWAKAFLRKGAAGFIAATGYAYGDTELTEYGERLFVGLSQQLRTGSDSISLGQALVEAKRAYLAQTAQVTGIDQKTIVEMTLYGLPMMKVDMPGARLTAPTSTPVIQTPVTVPGGTPGLTSTTAVLGTSTTAQHVPLVNLVTNTNIDTTYYTGRDGVVANPNEPILPKQIDDVSAAGKVLRGVAFRGGTYTDTPGITPLTTSPATETSGPHGSFNTDVFYPNQVWMPNFYDAVDGGTTRVVTVPGQFKSSAPGQTDGTVRTFSNVELAMYYLPNDWTASGSAAVKGAAVSPAPTITGTSAKVSTDGSTVTFRVNAQADGSAGVQSVWIVYTGETGSPFHGRWVSVDLVHDAPNADPTHIDDPTLWTGTLALAGADANGLRFMVQAVNGAGLTTLSTNLGSYYSVAGSAPPLAPTATTIAFTLAPPSGTFQTAQTFRAHLRTTQTSAPIGGQTVVFDIGGQQVSTQTDGNGDASATLTPLLAAGPYTAQVSVRGNSSYLSSSAASPFTVTKAGTTVTLAPSPATAPAGQPTGVVAHLEDSAARKLGTKSVVFIVTGGGQTLVRAVITDIYGDAPLGTLPLAAGSYSVAVYFGQSVPIGGGQNLDLTDERYGASQRAGLALTLTDTSAPTITVAVTNADSTAYAPGTWTKQNVNVVFTCVSGSGVASCEPPRSITTEGITPASTGTVIAVNSQQASVAVPAIQIDKTGPVITVTTPPAAASYTVGTVVNAAYTCTDVRSGVATCVGTAAAGQPIDTATAGPKSFTVNATDVAGNTSTKTVAYSVTAAAAAPVVKADMGIAGLQEIGFQSKLVILTGSFTDADGVAPYKASVRWTPTGSFTPFVLNNNTNFIASFLYPSNGARVVTVKVCDKGGTCGTDDVTVQVGVTQKVTPVRECVTDRGNRSNPRYQARFGYNNPATFPIYIPTVSSSENAFTSSPNLRGQPQIFLPGNKRGVFNVNFNSGSISWKLNGTTVTANSSSPRC